VSKGLEDDAAIDAIIALTKHEIGEDGYAVFFEQALTSILADIREDLSGFGIDYQQWFSERSLFNDGKVERAIEKLKSSDHVYQKGGAWWFLRR